MLLQVLISAPTTSVLALRTGMVGSSHHLFKCSGTKTMGTICPILTSGYCYDSGPQLALEQEHWPLLTQERLDLTNLTPPVLRGSPAWVCVRDHLAISDGF